MMQKTARHTKNAATARMYFLMIPGLSAEASVFSESSAIQRSRHFFENLPARKSFAFLFCS